MKKELDKLIGREISFHKQGGAFLYGLLVSVENDYFVIKYRGARQIHTISSIVDVYESLNDKGGDY